MAIQTNLNIDYQTIFVEGNKMTGPNGDTYEPEAPQLTATPTLEDEVESHSTTALPKDLRVSSRPTPANHKQISFEQQKMELEKRRSKRTGQDYLPEDVLVRELTTIQKDAKQKIYEQYGGTWRGKWISFMVKVGYYSTVDVAKIESKSLQKKLYELDRTMRGLDDQILKMFETQQNTREAFDEDVSLSHMYDIELEAAKAKLDTLLDAQEKLNNSTQVTDPIEFQKRSSELAKEVTKVQHAIYQIDNKIGDVNRDIYANGERIETYNGHRHSLIVAKTNLTNVYAAGAAKLERIRPQTDMRNKNLPSIVDALVAVKKGQIIFGSVADTLLKEEQETMGVLVDSAKETPYESPDRSGFEADIKTYQEQRESLKDLAKKSIEKVRNMDKGYAV